MAAVYLVNDCVSSTATVTEHCLLLGLVGDVASVGYPLVTIWRSFTPEDCHHGYEVRAYNS